MLSPVIVKNIGDVFLRHSVVFAMYIDNMNTAYLVVLTFIPLACF